MTYKNPCCKNAEGLLKAARNYTENYRRLKLKVERGAG